MRILLLFTFTILLSCTNNDADNKYIKIDINNNLTFDEFKKLIEEKGLEKNYPDINK